MQGPWDSIFATLATSLLLLQPATAHPNLELNAPPSYTPSYNWTIERVAAIGDSYATGVGSGKLVKGGWRCSRYDHGYPYLVNAEIKKGVEEGEKAKKENFKFLPCVSYKAGEVSRRQVSKLGNNIDVVRMSLNESEAKEQYLMLCCR
jgi:hypothetical protein